MTRPIRFGDTKLVTSKVAVDAYVLRSLYHEDSFSTTVPVTKGLKYRGDFHGLLHYLNVPAYLFNATTVLNNLSCSSAYLGNFPTILLYNKKIVNRYQKLLITSPR